MKKSTKYKKLLKETIYYLNNDVFNKLMKQKRYKEAEPIILKVCELFGKLHGKENLNTLTSKANLATLYRKIGKLEEAKEIYEENLESCLKLFDYDEKHPNIIAFRRDYKDICDDLEMQKEEKKYIIYFKKERRNNVLLNLC